MPIHGPGTNENQERVQYLNFYIFYEECTIKGKMTLPPQYLIAPRPTNTTMSIPGLSWLLRHKELLLQGIQTHTGMIYL